MSNTLITYTDIRNFVINQLKGVCCNIDKNPPSMTTSQSKSNGKTKLTLSLQNVFMKPVNVSSSTVGSQLDSFLSQRGLLTKPTTPITGKSLINLFGNIAIFIRAKTWLCPFMSTPSVVYNHNTVTYTASPIDQTTSRLTSTDVSGTLTSLINSINDTSNIKTAEYTIQCVCSSSSSCSSSSCSSSCCSSSSSSFIVYMMI